MVLDPDGDPKWEADIICREVIPFLDIAKRSRSCFLFVDEAGLNCKEWDSDSLWLATRSRHWGHSVFFISQRAKMVGPTFRDQCRFLYLFNCSGKDSEKLADEWNKPELREANTLRNGEYFYAARFREVKKLKVF